MLPALVALFVLSGAAGLMYESIWTRYLGLFVGHGAYAQLLVLVIFLGGMSWGAHAAGRRSERVREPLRAYALVELLVGAIGLLFHPVFVAVTNGAYDRVFPALPGAGAVLVVKWLLAALLILPQSVLLGATFPLMSAGALRRTPGEPGRTLSLLYFSNSLGAAGGVLVAGFGLLAAYGLPGTLAAAAALNVAVAAGAWLVARDDTAEAPAPAALPDAAPAGGAASLAALRRALLLVAFGTAAASFVYEIAWIRMLSLVVGSATHSFELMLSAFILGLALGALWVRRRADRWADPVRALGLTQWVMGSLAIATLPVYLFGFRAMAWLLDAVDLTVAGYHLFGVARYLMCLAVMLPATFCAGVTLPLITRVLLARGAGERAVGQVYAVNTLGSIVGAALAGLVLMPLVGLRWLLVIGALLDVALGVWLLHRHGALAESGHAADPALSAGRRRAAGATATADARALVPVALVGTAVLIILAGAIPFDPAVLTSGVYRYGVVADPSRFLMPFYADGRTATVSVRRHVESRTLTLATNGKPDASLALDWIRPDPRDTVRLPVQGDQVTQLLLPLIALAHAPGARTAAVIGQGSGMSSHLLLGSDRLRELRTIDIEPAMIRGSREFYPANRRVFDDPRSHFVLDDAKAYFAGANRRFDLILSEPSNPWVSGVSGLFTDEFYGRVTRYLAPGGVFGQWLHLYEIDDTLVTGVLAALHRHFPSYAVYLVSGADLLVVASNGPALPAPDWSVLRAPGLAGDLRHALPIDSATLAAARLADRAALAPLLAGWRPVNSDYHPVLDLGAERARFLKRIAAGYRALPVGRFDPVSAMRGWRVGLTTATVAPLQLPRSTALARGAAVRMAYAASGGGGEAPVLALPTGDEGDVREALYRRATLDALLAAGRAPADWHRFVGHVLACEDDWHGGSAGVADPAFYDPVARYLLATGAPREATAAVQFARALAAYDWPAARAAGEVLLAAYARGDQWIDTAMLHDGGTVAALMTGDPAGARRVLAVTGPRLRRAREDVRGPLLAAWVAQAERAAAR
jgi:predicted membrane-bound spermidine synthase